MGNFFTSPQEKASRSLYDAAISGSTPFDNLMASQSALAKKNVGSLREGLSRETSERLATIPGDILSMMESAGVTFSSGITDTVLEAQSGIRRESQNREAALDRASTEIDINSLAMRVDALSKMLQTGLSGLSPSSTFGDVMAGLTTLGNLTAGTLIGLGPHGAGLIGIN